MRMWFCSSGFGPGPSVGIDALHLGERVGRAEHQQEEERATTNIVASAQPTSGSVRRLRNWWATTAR